MVKGELMAAREPLLSNICVKTNKVQGNRGRCLDDFLLFTLHVSLQC